MFEGLEKICDVYTIETYAYDETPKPVAPKPADFVVVKPKNTVEVSEILRFANDHKIPVFIRGGGTGLSGGAIPTRKGILLSTEKMRNIEI
ncbi:MAG: FAD-binding protein, partial [Archaeoglobaceae archaeon]